MHYLICNPAYIGKSQALPHKILCFQVTKNEMKQELISYIANYH
uniref:Uncharacterized protein n=1 Tax=Rhizophora mucronata TaxID=61149 RepID=A0A2P2QSQ3_RHIMU